MKIILPILFASTLLSCSNTRQVSKNPVSRNVENNAFTLTVFSTDAAYGYTEKNPINVGGAKDSEGPVNERRFLNALLGPNGEDISYNRLGSCCPFNTKNGLMGTGLLDMYEIKWNGQTKSIRLYINMYDAGDLKIPIGFTTKK